MSSQEKKNFLMRYRDCEREIVRLEEEIAREAVSVLIVKRPCVLLKGERK